MLRFILIVFSFSPLFVCGQEKNSESDLPIPKFKESVIIEKNIVEKMGLHFDSSHVYYGNTDFKIVKDRFSYDLLTKTDRIITTEYFGSLNTIFFNRHLIVLEHETICVYALDTDSIYRLNIALAQFVGINHNKVYFSAVDYSLISRGSNRRLKIMYYEFDGTTFNIAEKNKVLNEHKKYDCILLGDSLKVYGNSSSYIFHVQNKKIKLKADFTFRFGDVFFVNDQLYIYDRSKFNFYTLEKKSLVFKYHEQYDIDDLFLINNQLFSTGGEAAFASQPSINRYDFSNDQLAKTTILIDYK